MITPNILSGAALLAALILTLVQFGKPFLPAGLQGDQRDAALRLLAVLLGAVGQLAVYFFTAAHVTRPDLGAAIALGMGSGYMAILSWHGGALAASALRQGPVPAIVPVPVATPAAVAPAAAEQPAYKAAELPPNILPPAV